MRDLKILLMILGVPALVIAEFWLAGPNGGWSGSMRLMLWVAGGFVLLNAAIAKKKG